MESIQDRVSVAARDTGAAKVVAHYTLRALMWLIVATAMGVWLLIGFFFWIPLLLRAAVAFSVEVVNATLTGRSAEAAGHMLRRAVDFYKSGFVTALEAIEDPPEHRRPVRATQDEDEEMVVDARGFLNEVAWTLLIWYLIASTLGWTAWTPFRVWNEFWAIEWGHHFGIIWYSFKAWLAGFGLP